jgi:hypothetical protein
MKKMLMGSLVLVAFLAVISSAQSLGAKTDDGNEPLPQTEGVYDVPGKPDMKLRVFVHHGKPEGMMKTSKDGKPQPPAPSEQCVATSSVDFDAASVVSAAGWKLPAAWTYNFNPSSVPSTIGTDRGRAMVKKSYSTWQNVLGTSAVFVPGADTSKTAAKLDGQNIVTWGRASGTALAVTYIWYDNLGEAIETDTIINNRFTWYWSDPSLWPLDQTCAFPGVYDAQSVLTHELGHTVGLDDEYTAEYQNCTMYGYGDVNDSTADTLTTGDIAGAKNIYGLSL